MDSLGYVHDLRFRELVSKGENETIKANVNSVIKLTKTGKVYRIMAIKQNSAAKVCCGLGPLEKVRRKMGLIIALNCFAFQHCFYPDY